MGVRLSGADRREAEMVRLVEPLIPALRRYARMLSKDRSAADDLVQDCLERLFTRWHLRRPDDDLKAWVFTILHNIAVNHFRRASRHGRQIAIDEIDEAQLSFPARQEDAVTHAQVLAAIDRLPDEHRGVFLLIAVEELSYAEAASILDIPIGTVMSRLHRARARLQSLLTDNASPPALRIVR
ncbi:MAG TPA: RNA polymerase sigma factor [Methylovirgula sp.]|jgi:RNA polymerase sigma factor (sigma-70 family)|nr:RNA polymerase sigma factor [Methylovirgula sp.]